MSLALTHCRRDLSFDLAQDPEVLEGPVPRGRNREKGGIPLL